MVFTDYLPIVKNLRKHRSALMDSSMLDIWSLVWAQLDKREGSLDVRWTKSHPTQSQIEMYHISDEEIILNTTADKLAGEAARRGALPADDVRQTMDADEKSELI